MKILGVIPAFNAEQTVGGLVRKSLAHLSDVIVVDDGSSDKTGYEAANAGAIVLRHEVNRGKGAALKTAFEYATSHEYDAAITLDADGQHLPEDIPKLSRAFSETGGDLIIGSRRHLFAQMIPRRRMANKFSSWAISVGSGAKVDDSQSGYRLYSARLMKALPIRSSGFDMESEVIVRAARSKMKIVMIPIELGFVDGLQTSYYRPIRDTFKILGTALRTRFLG
ncbi:MAG TPA: glycosyltransferase family 2 protein [Thermoanaerobaculia bacterium]|nr:glycosyltransferase family 2 protein [Thermoanaerobaculia bacterium]